jgi:uncharacterized protein
MKLHLSPDLALPIDAATKTLGVVGKKGSGKTVTGKDLAEEFLKAKIAPVIVDPLNVWWGLRSGFPVYVIGEGDHSDVNLEAGAGKMLARLVAEKHPPVVLSLRHLDNQEQYGFVADFCNELLRLNDQPCPVIIDEADKYAPQRPGDKGLLPKCKGAVDRLVRHGRSSGLGCTLITQRPALIDKNVLNQVDSLIIMRLIGPTDIDAVEAWLERWAEKKQLDEILGSLARLKTGEGWFYSPEWMEMLRLVRFRMCETFDSSREPKAGEKVARPTELATVDVDALGKEIAATVARTKADDPKELRAKIRDLEKRLTQSASMMRIEPSVIEKRIEVVPPRIGKEARNIENAAARLVPRLKGIIEELEGEGSIQHIAHEIARTAEESKPVYGTSAIDRPEVHREANRRNVELSKRVDALPLNGSLGKGERKVLIALAQYPEGCARDQLTILTGYKRSTRDAYVQRLSTSGYAEVRGANVFATDSGVEALGGDYEPLPVGGELAEYWKTRLPSGERAVFLAVMSRQSGISREEISERTDFKRSTRDAYIQRLAARRLVIVDRDGVRPAEILFG